MKKITLLLFAILCKYTPANAQFYVPGGPDSTIYQIYNNFYAGYTPSASDTLEDGLLATFNKWYNFWEPRLSPSGNFRVAARAFEAYSLNAHQNSNTLSPNFCNGGTPLPNTWTELGPNQNTNSNSGQVYAITFDPNNPATMYVGGEDGGVYQSTNSGANWVNMGTDWSRRGHKKRFIPSEVYGNPSSIKKHSGEGQKAIKYVS